MGDVYPRFKAASVQAAVTGMEVEGKREATREPEEH